MELKIKTADEKPMVIHHKKIPGFICIKAEKQSCVKGLQILSGYRGSLTGEQRKRGKRPQNPGKGSGKRGQTAPSK